MNKRRSEFELSLNQYLDVDAFEIERIEKLDNKKMGKSRLFGFCVSLLVIVVLSQLFVGCSLKSEDEASEVSGIEAVQFDPSGDSDGDRITNGRELELGLNPQIADIPKLKSAFLQNYSINFTYKLPQFEQEITETIDTRIGREDPDFKYRVGSVLVRDQSLKEAARIGQYSGHIWGDIRARDLTWIKYPEVDPRFYQRNQVIYSNIFTNPDVELTGLSIELESSIRLLSHPLFQSIQDLELNFYYYSHERESWELLATKLVERTFGREQTETFSVTLENVPVELVRDSYLKRGEFIVSEIKDFKIGDSGQTYKSLMESVKAKTVQLIINTPHGIEQNFVAPNKGDTRLPALLTSVMQYRMQDNDLVRLGEFENNLPAYTYLKEVRDQDKKGLWFTLTKRLNQHYLAHSFDAGDAVVMSYVTGKELASQQAEQFLSMRRAVSGGEDYALYPLGNISPNSEVNFYLRAGYRRGDGISSTPVNANSNGGSCGRNCSARQFYCNATVNSFRERNDTFSFNKDFSGELSQVSLMVNDYEYSLKTLVEEKKIKAHVDGLNAHFEIIDINAIYELNPSVENVLALKLYTEHGTTFNGMKLTSATGADSYTCAEFVISYAFNNSVPISVESVMFDRIQAWGNWSVLRRGETRAYSSPFEVDVSAHINNFYN